MSAGDSCEVSCAPAWLATGRGGKKEKKNPSIRSKFPNRKEKEKVEAPTASSVRELRGRSLVFRSFELKFIW